MEHVHDLDDPRLGPYRGLCARPHARDPDRVIVESAIAIERLLQSKLEIESVAATESHAVRLAPLVGSHVPVLVLEQTTLDRLVERRFHRGCLACARRPDCTVVGDRDLDTLAGMSSPRIVIAERIADPANVGALIRNCRAFSVDLLVLDSGCADPYSRRAVRTSMGNVFRQRMAITRNVAADLERIRSRLPSCRILAATTDPRATPVGEIDRRGSLAIVVGNEGAGLSDALCALADQAVVVTIDPGADSLNVAAATAVLLHALRPV